MMALAITGIHPSIDGTSGNEQWKFNNEWFEIANVGSEPIKLRGLFLKVKTGVDRKGFEREFNPTRPNLEIAPETVLRIHAGGNDEAYDNQEKRTHYFLSLRGWMLNEQADVIAIYATRQDCLDGRLPMVQVNYFTAHAETAGVASISSPVREIPF